jgi:outer membrane protein TolC
MKRLAILLFSLWSLSLYAQQPGTLSLTWCNQRAIERYPLKSQEALLQENSGLKINNLTTNYYPQVSLNGQATYQSDVTGIDINLPFMTIVPPDKDQYKLSLDLGQLIYDGGVTSTMKELEKKDLEYQQKSLDAELYKVKEKVSQVYFGILQLQLASAVYQNSLDDLKSRLELVKSAVKNGIMLETNAMILEAEIVKLDQLLSENSILLSSQFRLMSQYLDTTLSEKTVLSLPEISKPEISKGNFRLENEVFRLQSEKLDISRNLAQKKLFPKISAFGQVGYGRPGLNMLSSEFDSFYMVGARFTWTFWNWNLTSREKQSLHLQRKLVDVQKQTFDFSLETMKERQFSEILRLQEMQKSDEKLIAIRAGISTVMGSQLENGIVTASQYVTEKNNEINARLNKSQHEVQLGKAKVEYEILRGKF